MTRVKVMPGYSEEEEESAEEVLNSVLTEEELDSLLRIKHEIGACVRWETLSQDILDDLEKEMDTVIFLEQPVREHSRVKRNPLEALFPKDQAMLMGSSDKTLLFQDYLKLQLMKKLVGNLKSKIKRRLDLIEVVDQETEAEIRACIEPASEEEMDLTTDSTSSEVRCGHLKITVRRVSPLKSESGMVEHHHVCRSCREVVAMYIGDQNNYGTRSRAKLLEPSECYHPNAVWKEGEEGKVAICSNSSCQEPFEDPSRFLWTKAGLEPYGDNPEEDEIVCIPTGTKLAKEMSA